MRKDSNKLRIINNKHNNNYNNKLNKFNRFNIIKIIKYTRRKLAVMDMLMLEVMNHLIL